MPPPPADDLPIFVHWLDFLAWLLPLTAKFPQRARFTFANRLDNLALDMVEDLVEARYSRQKQALLARANLRLEKLRVLLRLCHHMAYVSHAQYEHAVRLLHQVGSMLGGWRRQQETQT